ncbi:glycosyltransferase [Pontibacter sp. G13]|uniref:glycosyltransferase n=1 Tax=Pontibacter sp. G13 TaxID=3074898 RepID=UPI00288A7FDC|nr:glycosyltransferase [Pontibacter sp. G13]WNJ16798.1 glycosyltransferase [Pontibacter sp. G13]
MQAAFPTYWVVPDPQQFVSGGNIFNHRLMTAARLLGATCKLIDPESVHEIAATHPESWFGWDSLFMKQAAAIGLSKQGRHHLIVHHLTSLWPPEGISGVEYFETYERHLVEPFSGFMATSSFTQRYLLERLGANKPCYVVEPGLSLTPKLENPTPAPRLVAVMAANIVPRKGLKAFLEKWVESGASDFGIDLRIWGHTHFDEPYASSCLALIRDGNLPVKIQPPISQEEWAQQLAEADFYLSTSEMESFGMALQEAASTGLPLLVLAGGYSAHHVTQGSVSLQVGDLFQTFCEWGKHPQAVRNMRTAPDPRRYASWEQSAEKWLAQIQYPQPER